MPTTYRSRHNDGIQKEGVMSMFYFKEGEFDEAQRFIIAALGVPPGYQDVAVYWANGAEEQVDSGSLLTVRYVVDGLIPTENVEAVLATEASQQRYFEVHTKYDLLQDRLVPESLNVDNVLGVRVGGKWYINITNRKLEPVAGIKEIPLKERDFTDLVELKTDKVNSVENVVESMTDEITNLQRARDTNIEKLNYLKGLPEWTTDKIREEFKVALKGKLKNLIVTPPDKVEFILHNLYMQDEIDRDSGWKRPLDPVRVTVDLPSNSVDMRNDYTLDTVSIARDGLPGPHPHVRGSSPCLGNASSIIGECIENLDLYGLYIALLSFLETYNRDDQWGEEYWKWGAVWPDGTQVSEEDDPEQRGYICPYCDSEVEYEDQLVECYHCGREICCECGYYAQDTVDVYYCERCIDGHVCSDCDDVVKDLYYAVDNAEKGYCKLCADDHRCRACGEVFEILNEHGLCEYCEETNYCTDCGCIDDDIVDGLCPDCRDRREENEEDVQDE